MQFDGIDRIDMLHLNQWRIVRGIDQCIMQIRAVAQHINGRCLGSSRISCIDITQHSTVDPKLLVPHLAQAVTHVERHAVGLHLMGLLLAGLAHAAQTALALLQQLCLGDAHQLIQCLAEHLSHYLRRPFQVAMGT